MPMYTYECLKCKLQVDLLSSVDKRDEDRYCEKYPECTGEMKRIITNCGMVDFKKGKGGFYKSGKKV